MSMINMVFKAIRCTTRNFTSINFIREILLLFIAMQAFSMAAEGTIGWSYLNESVAGYKPLYAPSPMSACSNTAFRDGSLIKFDKIGSAYVADMATADTVHPLQAVTEGEL